MHCLTQLFSLPVVLAVVTSIVLASAGGQLPAQGEESDPLAQKIDRLIEQLGDEEYSVRERAQKELAELGFDAYEALQAATTHEDLEIAARARYLLLLIPAQWSIENEPEEVRRWLTYYQSRSEEVRIEVLKVLARLPEGIGVPALCRLVRFEKSTPWSKLAAAVLLDWEPVDGEGRARWAKALREHLGRSRRPAAQWLHAYLQLRDDPKAALARLAKLAEEEQAVLEHSPDQSSPQAVSALLYHVAMAQADQGEAELAEQTAQRARELGPGRSTTRLDARLSAAVALQRRGRFRWAELECEEVIKAGLSKPKVQAQLMLSEMRHDQGNDLAAAEVLNDLLEIDSQELEPVLTASPLGRTVAGIRARMNYFHASHWAQQGDRARQRQFLDEAIRHDPAELDVLIARYQLPDAEPEYHRQTIELIEKAASELRQEIEKDPERSRSYNEFAWLVGNTEGDLDEALRYAQKALEIQPDAAAYLDTLAHVYYARGDLENAVKCQTKAAEFEPHSGLIRKKLELFRNALEENKKSEKQKEA